MENTGHDSKRKIVILAPDKGSGDDFAKVFNDHLNPSREVDIQYCQVPPRVEEGSLTKNVQGVKDALFDALKKAEKSNPTNITIACNTLSLPIFADEMLKKYDGSDAYTPKLITTIQKVEEVFFKKPNLKAVLLGTKPLTIALGKSPNIKTLETYEKSNALDLVQEIIWRVKAMQNSDVSTAPHYKISLLSGNNVSELGRKISELDDLLVELGVEAVIMGCTEIPAAYELLKKSGNFSGKYELIDPAMLVATEINSRSI